MKSKTGKKSVPVFILIVLMLINTSMGALASQADDVADHWAGEVISEWINKGLAAGYPDGAFRPDSSITRAEFTALTNRAFGFGEEEAIGFSDVSEGDWFAGEVKRAKAAGYIGGYPDGTMKPGNPISRQEAAVIITKIKGLTVNPGYVGSFSDCEDIGDWSMGEVGAAAQAGYMGGYPDGSFRPLNPITRAEALTVLDRALYDNVWVIGEAGIYGPGEGTQSFDGNVEIRADGVTLQNVIIDGNLTIAEEVGEGEVTLNNVTVEGDTYIRGGGPDSIYINGGDYKNIIIQKTGGRLRIVMVHDRGASVLVAEETEDTEIILEGTFDRIDVKTGGITLTVQGETAIKEIKIDKQAEDVAVNTSKDTVIDKMTVNTSTYVKNEGRIIKAEGTAAETSEYEINLPENLQPTPSRRSGGSSSQQPPSDPIAVLIAEGWIPVATPEDLHAIRGMADERTFGGDTGYNAESKGGLDKRYIQVGDIDLDVAPWNEDEGWEPIGNSDSAFNGTYDGNGMGISNLFINSSSDNIGLFGYMEEAEVKNVYLVNVDVKGNRSVGGLAGYNSKGIISDSQVEGTVTGQDYATGGLVGENRGILQDIVLNSIIVEGTAQVGGLAGSNLPHYSEETESYDPETGFISNCHVEENVTVTAGSSTGGLAGANNNGIIEKSSSRATVSGTYWVGGLVGSNNSTVRESFSSGSVSGTATSNGGTGGLIGYSWGEIVNCYSTASVTGPFKVGGLVGRNATGITNSYSTGKVTGTDVANEIGGLVGECNSGSVENCYWDTQTSEQTASAAGTGYQTAQMIKSVNSVPIYTDWDFVYTWDIKPGESYLYLRWQSDENIPYPPSPFAGGSGTSGNPYRVASAEQLDSVRDYPSSNFIQTADIDLSGIDWNPIGGVFSGTYNGQDNKISNLTEDGSSSYFAVFEEVGSGGELKNIFMENVFIEGRDELAALVSTNRGLIDNCHVDDFTVTGEEVLGGLVAVNEGDGIVRNSSSTNGTVTASEYPAGGLIGESSTNSSNEEAGIFNCFSDAEVSAYEAAGGLVGAMNYGIIKDSHATGDVEVTDEDAGGLAGTIWNSIVEDSYATGTVTGLYEGTGGLIGEIGQNSTVKNCYAEGGVSGYNNVGGLGGYVSSGVEIINSYASGQVQGTDRCAGGLIGSGGTSMTVSGSFATGNVVGSDSYAGGLIGEARNGLTVSNSYAWGDVEGQEEVGGLIGGSNSGSNMKVEYCYALGTVSGTSELGGLIGGNDDFLVTGCYFNESNNNNGYGNPKSDEQLKNHLTYINWDFDETWDISPAENSGYPFLRWQY